MPRVKSVRSSRTEHAIEVEIARLRDLDLGASRPLAQRVRPTAAPSPAASPAVSDPGLSAAGRPAGATWMMTTGACSIGLARPRTPASEQRMTNRTAALVRPGTMLGREWNGRMHRVAVLSDGFAWNGKTYPSLSKVAFAITGTRWSGPKFFGLRDKPSKRASR